MILLKFFLSFFLLLLCTPTFAQEDPVNLETLQLVQVIFRHGQRVPEYPYPTDPYNSDTFWKEGWGQLTEEGKKQGYLLGQYLRSRYKTFVSENYVANEMYILSSDLDRTIISAQVCLAGMFPTLNGTQWNPQLNWQPVPVHTIRTAQDNLLRMKRDCPKYRQEFENVLYNSPEFSKINADNAELFQYLSKNSGVNVTNLNEIDDFYATLLVEEQLGLKIPDWAVSVINTDNFQTLYKTAFAASSSTLQLKRLRAGPLINDLESHLQERITNSSMKTKFFIYSAHDTTLVNVLNTLDTLDLQIPPYSSAFLLELHKRKEDGSYFVNILYRNETDKAPYKMILPNCTFDCGYKQFIDFVRPFSVTSLDWDEECVIDGGGWSITFYIIFGAVILLGLALVYCLISKLLCRKRRSRVVTEYERF